MQIYIHSGPPRTGTTSFQMLLADLELADKFIFIPKTGLDTNSFGYAHHLLLQYDEEHRSVSLGEFKINELQVRALNTEISSANEDHKICILSSEGFAGLIPTELEKLRDILSNHSLSFIFSKRPIVDLHVSTWNKRVELGWTVDLRHSINDIFPQLHYSNELLPRVVDKIFGPESLIFIPYKANFIENIRSLCSACGASTLAIDFAIKNQVVLSESLGICEIFACLEANRILVKQSVNQNAFWISENMISARNILQNELLEENRERFKADLNSEINFLKYFYSLLNHNGIC